MELRRGRLIDHLHRPMAEEEEPKRFPSRRPGGRDDCAPAERSNHPRTHSVFVLDPGGSTIEPARHGPPVRSGPSVVTAAG